MFLLIITLLKTTTIATYFKSLYYALYIVSDQLYCVNFQYFKSVQWLPNQLLFLMSKSTLSYDVASGSEITTCIKIYKPLVVYRISGNVMK